MNKGIADVIKSSSSKANFKYNLICKADKYFLPKGIELSGLDHEYTVRLFYRRLFRLRPFLSKINFIKKDYTEYLRYKFKTEDYVYKRSIVLGNDAPQFSQLTRMKNSLMFIIKASTFLEEQELSLNELAADNLECRRILMNLITIEYQKNKLMDSSRERAQLFKNFRVDFNYLKDLNDSNTSKKSKALQYTVLKDYDRCLIYLNETLETML